MFRQYIFSIIFVYFGFSSLLYSQKENKNILLEINKNIVQEQISLVTDRKAYSVGDYLLFNATFSTNKYAIQHEWSNDLYVQLIMPNGRSILHDTLPITKNGVYGNINIPFDLPIGTYYLKAYTKRMQDYSTNNYAFCQVKILSKKEYKSSSMKLYSGIIHNRISLITDRTLYSIGEELLFYASYSTDKILDSNNWSTVLYIELIKPDGTPIIQEKFSLSKNGVYGNLKIPKDILSGVYYLKAYTKWMRNYSTNHYSYSQIKIINYNKSVIETFIDSSRQKLELKKDTLLKKNTVEISTNKDIFAKREKVTVKLFENENNKDYKSFCISVVRSGSMIPTDIHSFSDSISYNEKKVKFYPEINGISISGKVLDNELKIPESEALVNLTLLHNSSYYSAFNTNVRGEFFFKFPFSEKINDFYIQAYKNGVPLDILLDKEFCSEPVNIPYSGFSLSNSEILLAGEICLNTRISEAYEKPPTQKQTNNNQIEKSFYGTPNRTFYTQDYIELPYLEEFISELIHEISVIRRKNITSIIATKLSAYKNFPFLVMIDNVATNNLDEFLKIRTSKIDRVEIIDNGYISGDNIYSGIINVITKNKDMAGIELSRNSMFFSYKADSKAYMSFINKPAKDRTPDRRNTLFWAPDYSFNPNAENVFSFYANDVTGEYSIIIQGVTKSNNKVLLGEKEFIIE